jgi:hypothetical protein
MKNVPDRSVTVDHPQPLAVIDPAIGGSRLAHRLDVILRGRLATNCDRHANGGQFLALGANGYRTLDYRLRSDG